MKSHTTKDCCSKQPDAPTNCNLFDFMAHTAGVKVLHPGGYESSRILCDQCGIDKNSNVLDLACGAGTTAFFISDRYKCSVTGMDISFDLIHQAKTDLNNRNIQNNITFEVEDARNLPYPDNTFDVVISQAFFILIDDREKVLSEIQRVLKPNGRMGSLELSWFSPPPTDVYKELLEKTCSDFIPRVATFEDWQRFFCSQGLHPVAINKHHWDTGMVPMFKSEGIRNSLNIMRNMLTNPQARTKMMTVQSTFKKHRDYLGYGLYAYQSRK